MVGLALIMAFFLSLAGWLISRGAIVGIIQPLPLFPELALVLAVQGLVLWSTGLYKGLWRFASFPDLWNVARAATFGTILILATLLVVYGTNVRMVLESVLVYPAILFLSLGLPRMCYRFWKDSRMPQKRNDVGGFAGKGVAPQGRLRRRGISG